MLTLNPGSIYWLCDLKYVLDFSEPQRWLVGTRFREVKDIRSHSQQMYLVPRICYQKMKVILPDLFTVSLRDPRNQHFGSGTAVYLA